MSKRTTKKIDAVVLGAGPAGAAAAMALSRSGKADVHLLDRSGAAGGNASSFQIEGIWCDYGSHRFHPQADPAVLQDVARLLGDDLLLRPRHGRIRLGGRWIHFPLKPLDAIRNLPPRFSFSLMADALGKPLRRNAPDRTFASVLRHGLGRTISESFYFPYATKLWGRSAEQLSVTLAERRVSSGSVGKILTKMARMLPGLRGATTGRFYYPRKGFGQIVDAMVEEAKANGTSVRFGAEVRRVERDEKGVRAVVIGGSDGETRMPTDMVFSTIPLTVLARLFDPPPPPEVLEAADRIQFRGMILIYLILETGQFSEFDAHYFPEISIPISRMSEPKNYSGTTSPEGVTVLCAELPADPGDRWWSTSDDEFADLMKEWLASVDLPVRPQVRGCITRRLSQAYPVYDVDYDRHFSVMDEWFLGLDGLLVFGRQGLFAHDNTHHAIAMAYAAEDCLSRDGTFDKVRWAEYRRQFLDHRVED